MIKLLLGFYAAATTSTATIHLQGVVPRIVNKYVQGSKVIVDHNFPIVVPEYCVQVSQTRLECTQDLVIEAVE
jgi:hypothetical protein